MNARILIVDDDDNNRQLLGIMLAPEGYLLFTAASGEEALDSVAESPPDLILLDVMMPHMDGYQVVTELKRDIATKHIPIILLTAMDDRDARTRGKIAGAQGFLRKPVDRATLCLTVSKLLAIHPAKIGPLNRDGSEDPLSETKFDYLRTHLLGMIAHEVRSPAGVALTALTELESSLAGDPEHQRMLRIASRSVRRVLCVADRLSLAAELERGPLALQLAPVALRELVMRMGDEASEVFGRKGVVFELAPDEPDELPGRVEADERWLGPAILELIGNALRHARTRVRARLTVGESHATIVIEDDGRGFPEGFDVADRERFAPAGAVGGTGLSLCMVGDVAAAHGGRIFSGLSTLPPRTAGVFGAAVSVEIPAGGATAPPATA